MKYPTIPSKSMIPAATELQRINNCSFLCFCTILSIRAKTISLSSRYFNPLPSFRNSCNSPSNRFLHSFSRFHSSNKHFSSSESFSPVKLTDKIRSISFSFILIYLFSIYISPYFSFRVKRKKNFFLECLIISP